jgi:hypothetical protein
MTTVHNGTGCHIRVNEIADRSAHWVFTDTVETQSSSHLNSVAGGYCWWQNALQEAKLTSMHYLSRYPFVPSASPIRPG